MRRVPIVGLIVREPVPAQYGSLHHGLGDIRHRRLDGIGSHHRRGTCVRPGLPNLLAGRAHGLSNAIQGHVLFLSQPQQKHPLGRKGLSRMNQYGFLTLAGKLSGFPQLPELSAQRVIQRLMGLGQRVLVFIATDHEHVRGFLGNRTFLDLTLHTTLLSLFLPTQGNIEYHHHSSRMFKKAVQRGRSNRGGEAYIGGTLSLRVPREQSWWLFSTSC